MRVLRFDSYHSLAAGDRVVAISRAHRFAQERAASGGLSVAVAGVDRCVFCVTVGLYARIWRYPRILIVAMRRSVSGAWVRISTRLSPKNEILSSAQRGAACSEMR